MTAASFVRDITAFSVQIGLVGLGLAVLLKLVRIPAGVRFFGLRLALVASLVVPWLLRAPHVQAPAFAPTVAQTIPTVAVPGATAPSAAEPTATALARSLPAIPWTQFGFGALLIGIAARVLWLGMGVLRLLRLKRVGVVVDAPEYSELQQQLGTRATIAQVPALSQPATFGVRRPVVLLPDALAGAPASLRRAVVTHELFHVRRRDWLSVLAEEMVRTALWFHPAILWMTSQIQLAREEIVDELHRARHWRPPDVRGGAAGLRRHARAWPGSGVRAPPPVVSSDSQRVEGESDVEAPHALVCRRAALRRGWRELVREHVVPDSLKAAKAEQAAAPSAADARASTQSGSRLVLDGDVVLRNGELTVRAAHAAVVLLDQQTGEVVALRPVTPENPIPRRTRGVTPTRPAQFVGAQVVVSSLVTLDRNGAVTAVVRDGCSVTDGRNDNAVCAAFFDAVLAAIRQWRYDRPAQGPIQFYVRVTFRPGAEPTVTQSGESWASSVRETQDSLRRLAEADRDNEARQRAVASLQADLARVTDMSRELERAQRLALERGPANPDLARLQQELAQLIDARARAEARVATAQEYEQLRLELETRVRQIQEQESAEKRRAIEEQLREAQQRLEEVRAQLKSPSGRTPIRVSDVPGMKPPMVRKSVKPEHPLAAMKARVEGTVVLEAVVDEQGRVADVRVTKSIPLLDQAAMDAARQWEFTPTLMNGEPVPVLLMLEMNFAMR